MESIPTAAFALAVLLITFCLGTLAYIVGAIFVRTVRKRIAAHPFLHGLWFLMAALLAVGLLLPAVGPTPTHVPRVAKAQVMIANMETACKAYYAEYGSYPLGDNAAIATQLRGRNPQKIVFLELKDRDLSSSNEVIDPWGTPYKFELQDGKPPSIRSAGPDRTFGDEDDLLSQQVEERGAKTP